MDDKIIMSISKYIDNNMTEEEKCEFELLLKRDSEMMAEFEEQKELIDFINSFFQKSAIKNTSIRVCVMKRLRKNNRTKK